MVRFGLSDRHSLQGFRTAQFAKAHGRRENSHNDTNRSGSHDLEGEVRITLVLAASSLHDIHVHIELTRQCNGHVPSSGRSQYCP